MRWDLLVLAFLAGLFFSSAETRAATQDLGIVSAGQSGNVVLGPYSGFPNSTNFTLAQKENNDVNGSLSPNSMLTFSFSILGGLWTGGGIESFLNASLSDSNHTISAVPSFTTSPSNDPASASFPAIGSVFASLSATSGTVIFENLSSQNEPFDLNMMLAINLGATASGTYNVSQVPLPGSLQMFGLALALLLGARWLKTRNQNRLTGVKGCYGTSTSRALAALDPACSSLLHTPLAQPMILDAWRDGWPSPDCPSRDTTG